MRRDDPRRGIAYGGGEVGSRICVGGCLVSGTPKSPTTGAGAAHMKSVEENLGLRICRRGKIRAGLGGQTPLVRVSPHCGTYNGDLRLGATKAQKLSKALLGR